MKVGDIKFPEYSGVRCLMMPYIQGSPESLPDEYQGYAEIVAKNSIENGEIGFLTIDESEVSSGSPHRAKRARFGRALHTEAGRRPNKIYAWGGGGWGRSHEVELDRDVQILLANNLDDSCALWDAEHEETSIDGDIGDCADKYPYSDATFMKSSEIHKIGILTPHESVPVRQDFKRQFLRIVSSGVHGREVYFTKNPLVRH